MLKTTVCTALAIALTAVAPAAAQQFVPPGAGQQAPPVNVSPPRGKAPMKKCAQRARASKAKRSLCRLANERVVARKSAIWGYYGTAACSNTQVPTLFHTPPSVGTDTVQWIEHWNGFAYWAGNEWAQPQEWAGPFFSLPQYPHWFWYRGEWIAESKWGGWSQHTVGLPGARAGGVQYMKFHTTGESMSAMTSTDGCLGSRGYFGN